MNNRANIMYFIEHFCDMAQREQHLEFVRMMQRDILRVVDAVAPEDGSGAANVKVVRRVLAGMQQKAFLSASTVAEIEACLQSRDVLPAHAELSPVAANAVAGPQKPSNTPSSTNTPRPAAAKANGAAVARLDKRQIEQRIEEDRERHKRQRENIWAVSGNEDEEFTRLWDECSDVGEDDYLLAEEERGERRAAACVD